MEHVRERPLVGQASRHQRRRSGRNQLRAEGFLFHRLGVRPISSISPSAANGSSRSKSSRPTWTTWPAASFCPTTRPSHRRRRPRRSTLGTSTSTIASRRWSSSPTATCQAIARPRRAGDGRGSRIATGTARRGIRSVHRRGRSGWRGHRHRLGAVVRLAEADRRRAVAGDRQFGTDVRTLLVTSAPMHACDTRISTAAATSCRRSSTPTTSAPTSSSRCRTRRCGYAPFRGRRAGYRAAGDDARRRPWRRTRSTPRTISRPSTTRSSIGGI